LYTTIKALNDWFIVATRRTKSARQRNSMETQPTDHDLKVWNRGRRVKMACWRGSDKGQSKEVQ